MSEITNVLIIPHQPHRHVKVRALEMARYLAGQPGYRVHVLTWRQYAPPTRDPLSRIAAKLLEALKTVGTAHTVTESEGIHWIEMPYLLAPYPYCQQFNQSQVTHLIRELKIDAVINANAYHFPVPGKAHRDAFYIYDVVDDHLTEASGPNWEKTRRFTLEEVAKADRVITISHALQEVLAERGCPDSLRIPNGVDYESFQTVDAGAIAAVREKYDLQGKFVVGYIGNHGWWSGMRFLLEAWRQFRRDCPQARLLVVGPGEELPANERETAGEPDIIFTGSVPPTEVAAYFHASDLGVLPFDLNPFTHNALPLKLLEFGAARKPMLATPLKELLTLNLPHVELVEQDASRWADALRQAVRTPRPWQPEWDSTIRQYDWPLLLRELEPLLTPKGPHAPAV